MYKRILLFIGITAFCEISLSYASSQEEHDNERDLRLFPLISKTQVFTGIPIFDPKKDMEYLSEESQDRIQGIAESFAALRDYVQQRIAKDSWVVDSSAHHFDSRQSMSTKRSKIENHQYKLWMQQLEELQNVCCYFLSHKEYGLFLQPLQETCEWIKKTYAQANVYSCSIRLKAGQVLLSQTPELFTTDTPSPSRYLVSKGIGLERIIIAKGCKDPTGFYLQDLDKYAKHSSNHKEVSPLSLTENYKAYLVEFEKIQTFFKLIRLALKIKIRSVDKVVLGNESTISSIAKVIGLIPEHYEDFKKMRYQRAFEYRWPPVGVSLNMNETTRKTCVTDAVLIEKELEIAEILMSLEKDFLEAFSELSKDKVNFWLRDEGLVS